MWTRRTAPHPGGAESPAGAGLPGPPARADPCLHPSIPPRPTAARSRSRRPPTAATRGACASAGALPRQPLRKRADTTSAWPRPRALSPHSSGREPHRSAGGRRALTENRLGPPRGQVPTKGWNFRRPQAQPRSPGRACSAFSFPGHGPLPPKAAGRPGPGQPHPPGL